MKRIGFIGLGKMGRNMVLNLLDHKYEVVAHNRSTDKVKAIEKEGAIGAYSVEELVEKLPEKKVVWLMVSSGAAVDALIDSLIPLLNKGDIIIDGGNSYYKDTLRRAEKINETGLHYMDVGTSGGIAGARNGACMMIGAEKEDYQYLEGVFKDMNVDKGYLHCGPSGSGHFVKMIHNGVEYGIMEAYGEGFALLDKNNDFDKLDLRAIADVWNHGSIVESYLLTKAENALSKNPTLKGIEPEVADSGEGRWTILTAVESGVDTSVLAQALFTRFRTQEKNSFSDRLLAAIRFEFGGHEVKKK